jgi:DNA/RNA endonuclease G (NUC1)
MKTTLLTVQFYFFIFSFTDICHSRVPLPLIRRSKYNINISKNETASVLANNPWGDDDDNNCQNLPWISIQESPTELQYLIVKFDTSVKLPLISIYEHNELTDQNNLGRLDPFYDYNCDRLKGLVLKYSDYTNTGWSRGHLSPQMAFRYSEEARAASNYLINIAPQDLYSNTVPWSQIEQKLHKFLYGKKGLVITGTCYDITQSRSRLTRSLPITDCYWKIVCTKDNSNQVTAAAFYHRNIMTSTDAEKAERQAETYQVRDAAFVERLIHPQDWYDIWYEAEYYLDPVYDGKESIKFIDCYNARHLTSSQRAFWENAIGVFDVNFEYED